MKNNGKSRQSKGSIAQLVLGLIKSKRLAEAEGKDAADILLPAVKRQFPGSKFSLSHVYWYLGRYRRQLKAHKPVDHLVLFEAKPPAKAPHAKKAAKAVKAKAKKPVMSEADADLTFVTEERAAKAGHKK